MKYLLSLSFFLLTGCLINDEDAQRFCACRGGLKSFSSSKGSYTIECNNGSNFHWIDGKVDYTKIGEGCKK